MSTVILESPSGVPVTVNNDPVGPAGNPYFPEYWVAQAGLTPAEVTAAADWATYILLALFNTGICWLGNRIYATKEVVTVYDGQAIVGQCPFSEIATNGFSGPAIQGADVVADVLLKDFVLNRNGLSVDSPGIEFAGTSSRVKIDGVAVVDFLSAGTTAQTGGINFTNVYTDCDVVNCHVSQSIAVPGTSATGIRFYNPTSGVYSQHCRVENNDVDCANLKQGIVVDGKYNLNHKVKNNDVYGGPWSGILFGYWADSQDFNSEVSGNNCYNFGGPGIYISGNDGGPTYGTQSKGLTVCGNTVEYCGGISDGVFATGILLSTLLCTVTGNTVRWTGYDPGVEGGAPGPQRAFFNQCVSIGNAGTQGQGIYTITGNTIYGGFNGIGAELAVQATITGNSVWVENVAVSASVGQVPSSQIGSAVTISGNTLRGANLGGNQSVIYAKGKLSTYGSLSIVGNTIIGGTPATSIGIRVESWVNGSVQGNTLFYHLVAIDTTADEQDVLGKSLIIKNNSIDASYGMRVDTAGAASSWVPAGPNNCVAGVVPVIGIGTRSGAVKELLWDGFRRNLRAAAAPTGTELTDAAIGDIVTLITPVAITTPFAGRIVGYQCIAAGGSGTWQAILTCTAPS